MTSVRALPTSPNPERPGSFCILLLLPGVLSFICLHPPFCPPVSDHDTNICYVPRLRSAVSNALAARPLCDCSGHNLEIKRPEGLRYEARMRQEILEIPRALRLMLAKGRPQYDSLVRQAAWSERPVFITGDGASYWAALTGTYAFESLLKLPAVARTPEVFSAYTHSALSFRSLVIAISPSGECERTLKAVQAAKSLGAIVWGLTANPESRLAALADGVAPLFLHEAATEGMQAAFCQHASMIFLALAAARALKRPQSHLQAAESEIEKLPENIERVQNQFTDAARVLAGELRGLQKIVLTGGGLYHPAALQAAHQLNHLVGLPAEGVELLHFRDAGLHLLGKDTGIVILSGSRCELKAEVRQVAEDAKKTVGGKLFAITDSNDQPLSASAAMSVLLPVLAEPGGALLSLAFLDCVTHYAAAHTEESPRRRSRRLAAS